MKLMKNSYNDNMAAQKEEPLFAGKRGRQVEGRLL